MLLCGFGMMIRPTIILVMFSIILMGCGKTRNEREAQWVYINANVYTVNSDQPWEESMLVEDGVIQFVGNDSDADLEDMLLEAYEFGLEVK